MRYARIALLTAVASILLLLAMLPLPTTTINTIMPSLPAAASHLDRRCPSHPDCRATLTAVAVLGHPSGCFMCSPADVTAPTQDYYREGGPAVGPEPRMGFPRGVTAPAPETARRSLRQH
jgi:hypothetical protein